MTCLPGHRHEWYLPQWDDLGEPVEEPVLTCRWCKRRKNLPRPRKVTK